MLAPVCLFTYNRLNETKLTINFLRRNFLASESHLYVFSDGPKNETDLSKVLLVRKFIKTIDGFKSVSIFESESNIGLANSIKKGVSKILEKYETIIVLEDDLITSTNFLTFLNQALVFYRNQNRVFSIAGYSHKIQIPHNYNYSVYLRGRPTSWGWATWRNRWQTVDWEIKDWESFRKNKKLKQAFNSHGSDLFRMLKNSMESKNDSWAIRFAYNQIHQNKLTVSPIITKVMNIGFGNQATHCKSSNKMFEGSIDTTGNRNFSFTNKIELTQAINEQVIRNSSIKQRIINKLKTTLGIPRKQQNLNNILQALRIQK